MAGPRGPPCPVAARRGLIEAAAAAGSRVLAPPVLTPAPAPAPAPRRWWWCGPTARRRRGRPGATREPSTSTADFWFALMPRNFARRCSSRRSWWSTAALIASTVASSRSDRSSTAARAIGGCGEATRLSAASSVVSAISVWFSGVLGRACPAERARKPCPSTMADHTGTWKWSPGGAPLGTTPLDAAAVREVLPHA